MGHVEDDFLNRKLEHIIRDYQAGWSMGQKRADRINSIRTWNVTVLAAYLAYVATQYPKMTGATLLPLGAAIFLFWIMDAFTGSLGRFNMEYVIGKVDELFCKKTQKEFKDAIRDHKFFSQQNQAKKPWRKHGKWDRFARAFLNYQTAVFYGAPLACLLVYDLIRQLLAWPTLRVLCPAICLIVLALVVRLMWLLQSKPEWCKMQVAASRNKKRT